MADRFNVTSAAFSNTIKSKEDLKERMKRYNTPSEIQPQFLSLWDRYAEPNIPHVKQYQEWFADHVPEDRLKDPNFVFDMFTKEYLEHNPYFFSKLFNRFKSKDLALVFAKAEKDKFFYAEKIKGFISVLRSNSIPNFRLFFTEILETKGYFPNFLFAEKSIRKEDQEFTFESIASDKNVDFEAKRMIISIVPPMSLTFKYGGIKGYIEQFKEDAESLTNLIVALKSMDAETLKALMENVQMKNNPTMRLYIAERFANDPLNLYKFYKVYEQFFKEEEACLNAMIRNFRFFIPSYIKSNREWAENPEYVKNYQNSEEKDVYVWPSELTNLKFSTKAPKTFIDKVEAIYLGNCDLWGMCNPHIIEALSTPLTHVVRGGAADMELMKKSSDAIVKIAQEIATNPEMDIDSKKHLGGVISGFITNLNYKINQIHDLEMEHPEDITPENHPEKFEEIRERLFNELPLEAFYYFFVASNQTPGDLTEIFISSIHLANDIFIKKLNENGENVVDYVKRMDPDKLFLRDFITAIAKHKKLESLIPEEKEKKKEYYGLMTDLIKEYKIEIFPDLKNFMEMMFFVSDSFADILNKDEGDEKSDESKDILMEKILSEYRFWANKVENIDRYDIEDKMKYISYGYMIFNYYYHNLDMKPKGQMTATDKAFLEIGEKWEPILKGLFVVPIKEFNAEVKDEKTGEIIQEADTIRSIQYISQRGLFDLSANMFKKMGYHEIEVPKCFPEERKQKMRAFEKTENGKKIQQILEKSYGEEAVKEDVEFKRVDFVAHRGSSTKREKFFNFETDASFIGLLASCNSYRDLVELYCKYPGGLFITTSALGYSATNNIMSERVDSASAGGIGDWKSFDDFVKDSIEEDVDKGTERSRFLRTISETHSHPYDKSAQEQFTSEKFYKTFSFPNEHVLIKLLAKELRDGGYKLEEGE